MLTYVLEVSLYWGVFSLVYHSFLRKLTFFRFNRWYLLSSMAMGLILPFVSLEFTESSPVIEETILLLAPISNTPATIQQTIADSPTNIPLTTILALIYWIGMVIFFIQFLIGFSKIVSLYLSGSKIAYADYTLVRTNKLHLPFSFFNYIFWSKGMHALDQGEEKILIHEISHVKDGHSFDVLFMELVKVFLWCSPFVYWYKKSIKQVHEYIADHMVLQTTQLKNYGHLLLKQSQTGMQIALANHFIHSQLKNRIAMMIQKPSRRIALLKYLLILPFILAIGLLISAKQPTANHTTKIPEIVTGLAGDQALKENFDHIIDFDQIVSIILQGKPLVIFKSNDRERMDKAIIAFKNANAPNIKAILTSAEDGGLAAKYKYLGGKAIIEIELSAMVEINYQEMLGVDIDKKEPLEANEYLMVEIEKEKINFEKKKFYPTKANPDIIAKTNDSSQDIFSTVETMPRFPGCEDKATIIEKEACSKQQMLEFIYKNIRYPAEAREAHIQGMNVIRFVVEKDGSISNPEVVRGIGGGTDEESLRVVNLMNELAGKWTPGTVQGNPVRVYYNLPIRYKLENDPKDDEKIKIILILKDGSQMHLEHDKELLNRITPASIKAVNVLKGASLAEAYPDYKDYDGLIEIQTKWNKADVLLDGLNKTLKPHLEAQGNRQDALATEAIFKVVEEQPRFPGCEDVEDQKERSECAKMKMLNFIYQNIKYPAEARTMGIQGMVVVRFVVEVDGSLTNIEIVRDIGGGAGEEARRIVNQMNEMDQRWIPGKQRGKTVRVQYNLPVRYKLSDEPIEAPSIASENEVNKSSVINTLELDNLLIFPNPATNEVQITFSSRKDPLVISLYDSAGKEIFSESLQQFDGLYSKKIAVSNAARGLTILTVKQASKIFSTQILLN